MDNAAFSQLVAKKVEDGKFDIRKSIRADKASRKQQKKNFRKKQEEGTLPEQLQQKSELLAKGKGKAKKEGGYRDRAKERRTDTNPDYKGSAELAETISAEYTKFLGGDEEHTHLVKGMPATSIRVSPPRARAQRPAEAGRPTATPWAAIHTRPSWLLRCRGLTLRALRRGSGFGLAQAWTLRCSRRCAPRKGSRCRTGASPLARRPSRLGRTRA